MRKQNLPIQRLLTPESLTTLAHELRYPDISALYAAIGESHVSAQSVVGRLVESLGGEEGATEDIAEVTTPGSTNRRSAYGHRSRRRRQGRLRHLGQAGPLLHAGARRRDRRASSRAAAACRCTAPTASTPIAALGTEPEREVEVEWAPSASSVFLVAIQVEALDRSRLLSDVTRVLSDQHVNILSASVTTTRDRVAISRFTFEMGDPKHLGHVLKAVRSVDGVFDVYRITSGNS